MVVYKVIGKFDDFYFIFLDRRVTDRSSESFYEPPAANISCSDARQYLPGCCAFLGWGELFPAALGDIVTHSAPSVFSLSDDNVDSFSVRIEQKITHDPSHFIQGLFISGDSVFEETGRYGESKLIRYHLNRASNSLEVIWRKALARYEFGGGITMLNNVLY